MTPLESLDKLVSGDYTWEYRKECRDVIEKDLKEHEQLKLILKDFNLENPQNLIDTLKLLKNCKFEKSLQALEFIKERLDFFFSDEGLSVSIKRKSKNGISRIILCFDKQQEYDLLKEVLL